MLKCNVQLTDYTNNNRSNKTKIVITNASEENSMPNDKRFELIVEHENTTSPIRLTLSVGEMQRALNAIRAAESW